MEKKFKLATKPNWKIECIELINNYYDDRIGKIVEGYKKYNMKEEEIKKYLEKIILFSEKVTPPIIQLLENKYSIFKPFFAAVSDKNYRFIEFIVGGFYNILDENLTNEQIDDIVERAISMIHQELSPNEVADDYDYNSLTNIISCLNDVDIDSTQKIQIINYFIDKYSFTRKLVNMLQECEKICEDNYYIIEDEFNRVIDNLKKTNCFVDKIRKHVDTDLLLDENIDATVIASIAMFNGLSVTYREHDKIIYGEEKRLILIGMYLIELSELKQNNKNNDAQIVSTLKTMADLTRFSILKLLSKKEMYLQEIADAVKLTPATVSHHINNLLSNDLVTVSLKIEKRRVYYQINRKKLNALSEQIKQTLE